MPSTAKRLLHETVQFLIGLVALASLSWLCARLGFRPVSAALGFLILIVLLSLAGSFFGALALSFLALGSLAYFFSPRLVHLDHPEDIVAVVAFLLASLIVTGLARQLRAGRDELENVLHAMPPLVLNTSSNGWADFSNQRFRDYTGLSSEELLGRGRMNASHADDYSVERFSAALATGTPFEKEIRIRSAAGEYRWFLLRMTPLRKDPKTIVKWCGTASDVEERKRTEQALLVRLIWRKPRG